MKTRLLLSLPSLIFLFSVASLPSACSDSAVQTETRFLVDVRTPGEFAEGSAPGAVNIPLDEIESRLDEFRDKGEIVVMCRSGNRSRQAKMILEKHGFSNVTDGGPWQQAAQKYKSN